MRRAFSAVVSLTFAVSSLSQVWAGEKEEELLRAMEAIVQEYKADEVVSQQQSTAATAAVPASEQQSSQYPQQSPAGEAGWLWTNPPPAAEPPPAEQRQAQEIPAATAAAPLPNLFEPQPSFTVKDDIIGTIEQAVRQYRANDFAGAISNLDYAAQLIRQKKSERMKALLPEPLTGWQAKPASAKSLGAAVFGGGSTVSRDYFTASSAVSVEIVSDSPVLQSIIMMLNNPLFAGASGGNLQTVKQQRAMFKYNDNDRSGEINIVVAGRFIVTVKGRAVDQAIMLRYAEAMDFEALARN